MIFDPAWDMPQPNWVQQGSFEAGTIPPVVDPDAGTPVCIGPIANEWLPLVQGALDQLRNPSTWIVADDAAMAVTLQRVDQLRGIIAMATGCCNLQMRLEASCVLQFSTDDGATWTDVAGWVDNFANCVLGEVVPGVPLLPPGQTVDQRACNISAFLAEQLIQEAINLAITDFNANKTLISYITDLLPIFSFAFPITTFGLEAFVFLYTFITSANIADFEAASTDPVLIELVTCAIYGAIRPPGYVTATNKPAICSAIGALTYTYPSVISAISGFCSRISLIQLQSMQNVGIYNSPIDCGGCTGNWCWNWDFRGTDGMWTKVYPPGVYGTYVSGTGWVATQPDVSALVIERTFPATHLTFEEFIWNANCTNGSSVRRIYYYLSGSVVHTQDFPGGAQPAFGPLAFSDAILCDKIRISLGSDSCSPQPIVQQVNLKGTGGNPFGLNNCPP